MRVGAIIQARMTSSRLPGKVLRRVGGKPLLEYLLERIQRVPNIDCMIVATSSDESDDSIAQYCEQCGVKCHRGPLHHVASRFRQAMKLYRLNGLVRVCGDSPLLDPALVSQAVSIFRLGRSDLVTNLMPRSFPPGQSVEVMDAEIFDAAVELMHDRSDIEHVTPYFYRHANQYRIHNLTFDHDCGDARLAVDTQEDLNLLSAMIRAMDRPQWEYDLHDILALRSRTLGEMAAADEPADIFAQR